MPDKTIPSDFRIDIGRADQGRTFVRVVHVATGKDRVLIGLGGADLNEVAFQLTQEIANELDAERLDRRPRPTSDLQPR